MNRVYSFFIVPFILLSPGLDCESMFLLKQSSKGKSGDYSITLKLKEGQASEFNFELHDLNTGEFVAKKTANFIPGESKVVFENVKPSVYAIYFTSSDCAKKKSLKGKEIVLQ